MLLNRARVAAVMVAAGAQLGLGGLLVASAASAAVVNPTPEYNSVGEAGYSTTPTITGMNFRYVRATFTVTAQMKTLNNSSGSQLGGTGVQLCEPQGSTHPAGQAGIVWNSGLGEFQAAYDEGDLTAETGLSDACTSGGVISSSPDIFTGSLGTISVGDVVSFAIYYNKASGELVFTAADATTNGFDQESISVGSQAFKEAGVGIQAVDSSSLSAPADNLAATFTGIRLTGYRGKTVKSGTFTSGPWSTTEIESSPSASSATPPLVSPDNSLTPGGASFSDYIGSVVG